MSDRPEKENKLREERAFEALFVSSVRKLDDGASDADHIPEPSSKEQAALARVDTKFVETLITSEGNESRNVSPQGITQSTKEQEMEITNGKSSGVLVLAISVCIVALVVTLMWQSNDRQKGLAESNQS